MGGGGAEVEVCTDVRIDGTFWVGHSEGHLESTQDGVQIHGDGVLAVEEQVDQKACRLLGA